LYTAFHEDNLVSVVSEKTEITARNWSKERQGGQLVNDFRRWPFSVWTRCSLV